MGWRHYQLVMVKAFTGNCGISIGNAGFAMLVLLLDFDLGGGENKVGGRFSLGFLEVLA